ncbi:hypothetical protein [Priestia megaterium]|uniref:hypothetical protein n=1 Tax=Priestia megaterium TaxID=1404 RepID=UPI002FFE13B1
MKSKTKTPAGQAEQETPQENKRRGGSAPARGKRSHSQKSTAVEQAIYTRSFIQFVPL